MRVTKTSPERGASEGLLLVDKPEGPTSHDVVNAVRRAVGNRRVGHTGTLDPFASGLLLVCVGRATRLAEYFHSLSKTYRAVAVLGTRTDTDDRTGTVTMTSEGWQTLSLADIRKAASLRLGAGEQDPPAFSAKKIDGRRAYDLARSGESVQPRPVSIFIHRFDIIDLDEERLEFEVEVSTGTYVRALARDLGEDLGSHAHLAYLRRTSIGPFHVEAAIPTARLADGADVSTGWRSPAEAVSWMPGRELSEPELAAIEVGQAIPARGAGAGQPVPLLAAGRLVAMARVIDGQLRPEKVFPSG